MTGFEAVLEHYPSAPDFQTVLNLEDMCLRRAILSVPILSIVLEEMLSINVKMNMYFVVIKNPKALLKRTMISCSSQTPLVYNGYKLS